MKVVLIRGTNEETGSQVSLRRPIASPTNLELQASGCRGVRTLGQDLLDGIVVLLSIIVVRISLMCGIVQGHMLATEVGFPHTELTLVALPEKKSS